MAGIWERIKQAATAERCPSHLFEAVMVAYSRGLATGQECLDILNAKLQNDLAGAEVTDLNAIRGEIDAKGTITLKAEYCDLVMAAFILAESGSINETQFRNVLGIA